MKMICLCVVLRPWNLCINMGALGVLCLMHMEGQSEQKEHFVNINISLLNIYKSFLIIINIH